MSEPSALVGDEDLTVFVKLSETESSLGEPVEWCEPSRYDRPALTFTAGTLMRRLVTLDSTANP